jgi:hypothetical protein
MTLTSRLAETIGADPVLTQNIRIDVNVHNEPTVTVTRLASADELGRIISCSTFADYTLVQNDELKRLRNNATLTDEEREAIERAIGRELDTEWYGGPEPERVATLRGLLERLK